MFDAAILGFSSHDTERQYKFIFVLRNGRNNFSNMSSFPSAGTSYYTCNRVRTRENVFKKKKNVIVFIRMTRLHSAH